MTNFLLLLKCFFQFILSTLLQVVLSSVTILSRKYILKYLLHHCPPLAISFMQKPSKKSSIFQSLVTIDFVLFPKRQSQRGGHDPMAPL